MAQIPRDVEELRTVVAYLQQELGYRVKLRKYSLAFEQNVSIQLLSLLFVRTVVGHSKGALASFLHLKDAADPPQFYVNLSGRHDMKRAHRTALQEHLHQPEYNS